jgi:hypothetical protein
MRPIACAILACLVAAAPAVAQGTRPATTQPAATTLPFLQVDVSRKTLRMECRVVKSDYALEFLCVMAGTNEYEAVLSSPARASHLHLALLMLGLEPGLPLRYDQRRDSWLPPEGPPLQLSVEWNRGGTAVRYPAHRLLRNLKTGEEAPPISWVFVGSRMVGNRYMADATGSLVSVVNVDGTVLDVPQRTSSAMEERTWQPNWDLLPEAGTPVWLVFQASGGPATRPTPGHP